ncbi:MmgE/PrpD family protein [Pigmentiphaga soli]|uniref:MmgE/PrpD family protein n=1 Tax=Pigmentiphaga soli TaxID=1007095 RepID=A0ABP8H9D3_9BURK
MDATTERLVDLALDPRYARLPADVVHECKRRVVDTLACALGAYDESSSRLARAAAARVLPAPGAPAARVWGGHAPTTPEAAAFANGVMLRELDISDMYRVRSGGHPSDVMAGILAVGEAARADGAAVIGAITLAYDVYCSFCEAVDVNSRGWDQPVYGILGGVLGIARLLGLSREQAGHAVGLALAPNMALAQTRHNTLSAWKGCAAANASRNAVFAAYLAQQGLTGPSAVFEGKGGLWDAVGRFEWTPEADDSSHRIARTDLKSFPLCYHAQSAVWAALQLRGQVRIDEVEAIEVETYRFASDFLAGEPAKWAPATRETADHSLPYIVAVALLDGEVKVRSFAPARLGDPALGALMRKVRVAEAADLTRRYPGVSSCRLRVVHRDGRAAQAGVDEPKGSLQNPMSDAEIGAKFRSMSGGFCSESQCAEALDALWALDGAPDVGEVLATLARPGAAQPPLALAARG